MKTRLVKDGDIVVYANPQSYSHNAVVELLQNGEVVVVVQEQKRRKRVTHHDPTSKAVLLRSTDGGRTWNPRAKTTIAAGDREAINDPAIRQLRDGTLVLTYFKWRCGKEREAPLDSLSLSCLEGENCVWTTGTYTVRSADGGRTWEGPVRVPAPTGDETAVSDPVIELPDGELLIPLYGWGAGEKYHSAIMRSSDGGRTWGGHTIVFKDSANQTDFCEPSLLYLPSGKLICMHRVHTQEPSRYYYLFQSDSHDLGRTWAPPRQTAMWGHPPYLLRLKSGTLFCIYGYRREPYGIRACLSHDEGGTWDIANECVLRSDGINADVGYPYAVQLPDGAVFAVWYMCQWDDRGPWSSIGGTFLHEEG